MSACAFLAAIYLSGDAHRSPERDLTEWFRRRALASGDGTPGPCRWPGCSSPAPTPRRCITALPIAPRRWSPARLSPGCASLALVVARRYLVARAAAGLAVATIVWGWGIARYPQLLPGLPVSQAQALPATLHATAITVAGRSGAARAVAGATARPVPARAALTGAGQHVSGQSRPQMPSSPSDARGAPASSSCTSSRTIATNAGCVRPRPPGGRPARRSAAVPRASVSRSQATSRWSETQSGRLTTRIRRRPAAERAQVVVDCPARARHLRWPGRDCHTRSNSAPGPRTASATAEPSRAVALSTARL